MATKCCDISTVDLSYVVPVKSTVEISQNFVAFSEYMNFNLKKQQALNAYCPKIYAFSNCLSELLWDNKLGPV